MPIDPHMALSTEYPDLDASWDRAHVILYHLGLGAGANGVDQDELSYVYERSLKMLPTFSVIPGFEAVRPAVQGPGLDYKLSRMLHGEQELIVHSPLPAEATVVTSGRVGEVWTKATQRSPCSRR